MRAVVLSGGGGKGAYQIGVWKALRKLNYDYKIVTGTSIGAINGLMMVQKSFYRSYYLWKNFDAKKVLGNNFEDTQYIDYVKNFIKTGGVSTDNVEKFVQKLYNKKKFSNSLIDYGIVTYNFTKLKPCVKTKEELLNENIARYIAASATCFPAFKMLDIDGEKYIDGGYYDSLPINLAIDMGATEVVAIDLDAIGLRKKIKDSKVKIIYIKPNNEISGFLEFDKLKARRDIKYGYNDTMKKFGKLFGQTYTFYGNILTDKMYEEIKNLNEQVLTDKVRITNFKLSKYVKKASTKTNFQVIFDETLEYLLKKCKFDDINIYSAKKVSKKIYKELFLNQNTSKINFVLKNEQEENYRIICIYEMISQKKYKQLRKIINTMHREFLCALYLYFIQR